MKTPRPLTIPMLLGPSAARWGWAGVLLSSCLAIAACGGSSAHPGTGSSGAGAGNGAGAGAQGGSGGEGSTCPSSLPTGFAASPASFAIPAPRCQVSFDQAAQASSIDYATMTLTNACAASLVVFQDACDPSVGQSHWDVYNQL